LNPKKKFGKGWGGGGGWVDAGNGTGGGFAVVVLEGGGPKIGPWDCG